MSNVKIWIHLIFSTKHRQPFLSKNIRYEIFNHILENCKLKGISLKTINGHTDHVHCLISLGKDQNIAEVTQLIKGESSFWINKNKMVNGKFKWQNDYFAISIGEKDVPRVMYYIQNQEEHHSKKSFGEEVAEFLEKYDFKMEVGKMIG
jgi:putative transposase